MPVKNYGIFVAYSPNTEMGRDGLGRYLSAFLDGAAQLSGDLRFTIIVPSWSRRGIQSLLREHGIAQHFELLGPLSQPILLRFYRFWERILTRKHLRKGRSLLRGAARWLVRVVRTHLGEVFSLFGASRVVVWSVVLAIYLLLAGLICLPFAALYGLALGANMLARRGSGVWKRKVGKFLAPGSRLNSFFNDIYVRLRFPVYRGMYRRELDLMVRMANARPDILAWYSPAAFWPEVLRLDRPRLVCVPDVVLSDVPAGFAAMKDGRGMLDTFRGIKNVLAQDATFVTYSDRVRQEVLMRGFGVRPERIAVVRHAPINLSEDVTIQGEDGTDIASTNFARWLMAQAMDKANTSYVYLFPYSAFKYIIYPTQLRPSKNVMTLLRAYRYLLKEKYFGRKLLLTGNPSTDPQIAKYIVDNDMSFDVLFLRSLSNAELAGCYKLADLAVNVSLSEGGMPFTFSEAVSVGTPVIMGDIDVTREELTDPEVRAETLCDPYDWRAVAAKIETALAHRDQLYVLQRKFYDEVLARRTWADVVKEHVGIMDRLADFSQPRVVQNNTALARAAE
jgi:glycosyltransferase involved in cell wall biosynthesis